MSYTYSFDDTYVGNFTWGRNDYTLIQESLNRLLNEIMKWNIQALEYGAVRKPYEEEEVVLKEMIEYGVKELSSSHKPIRIQGISVGSLSYIKAALLLSIESEKKRLSQRIKNGWPNGVISAINEKNSLLQKLAEKIDQAPNDLLWEFIPKNQKVRKENASEAGNSENEWDLFICHASEDKENFVRPLASKLISLGLNVWYDELSLTMGDSLRRSIDRGLAHSRYGIVVISPNFLRKEWPQKELDGLVALEKDGRKVILPIWHQIEEVEVRKYSPTLADRFASKSESGLTRVIDDILEVIGKSSNKNVRSQSEPPSFDSFDNPGESKISSEAKTMLFEAANDKSGMILKTRTMDGTSLETNGRNLIPDQNPRTIAKWEYAIEELVDNHFIEERGCKGEVFAVTHQGYTYADSLKKQGITLQNFSSPDTSVSTQHNDLEFNKFTGTYISKEDGLRYCTNCKHSSSKKVPLKEQQNGWRCYVCGKFYPNPNYNSPHPADNNYDLLSP